MNLILLAIFAYFLGAIPFGLLIAKAHGKDLRKIGSGNIGATNLSRALGKKWAYVCFILDTAKGLIPMLIGTRFVSSPATVKELFLWLIVGCAAVIGHIFPIYLKFKGGKGVATSLGFVLGLWPYYTLCVPIALIIWIGFTLKWRYISLASIVSACIFPLCLVALVALIPDWQFETLWPLVTVAVIIPVLVVVRHKENIKRILAGTENKVFQK